MDKCKWCGWVVKRHAVFGWVHEATANTNGRTTCCGGKHVATPEVAHG